MPQADDTLYTEERAMDIYDREPERALRMIDSAEMVGNVTDYRAELLRARVYAYPGDAMNLDTARQLGVALLEHDSVKGSVDNRMEVLRLLTDVARIHLDYPEQVKWASELATLCREQGKGLDQCGLIFLWRQSTDAHHEARLAGQRLAADAVAHRQFRRFRRVGT